MVKLTRTYRRLVRDTTINDLTLLSTDYLNHFNELTMMVEMAADMPEMLEDALAWRFKSYQAHFADSVFQHKDLAVWAYEQAPDAYRGPLDRCTAVLKARIEAALPQLQALHEAGDDAAMGAGARALARDLARISDAMSAIINGAVEPEEAAALAAAAEADQPEAAAPSSPRERVLGQSDIDKLFD